MKLLKALILLPVLSLMIAASGCRSVERSASRRLLRGEARAVERQSARRLELGTARNLEKDLARDRASAARRLSREATAFRYTSKAEAERELRSGIRPGSHFTSKAGAGRPLAARSAQARYGLPRVPEVRETVRLQKGTMVKRNRAIGGARGVGEMTSTSRTERRSIKKILPLKQNQ